MCHRVAAAAVGDIVFVSQLQLPLLLSPSHRGCCYFCHHRVTVVAAVIIPSQSLLLYLGA